MVQLFAHIFRKEAQHQIAILLEQLVLAPVAALRDGIGEMLRAIELHGDMRTRTQQIDF